MVGCVYYSRGAIYVGVIVDLYSRHYTFPCMTAKCLEAGAKNETLPFAITLIHLNAK